MHPKLKFKNEWISFTDKITLINIIQMLGQSIQITRHLHSITIPIITHHRIIIHPKIIPQLKIQITHHLTHTSQQFHQISNNNPRQLIMKFFNQRHKNPHPFTRNTYAELKETAELLNHTSIHQKSYLQERREVMILRENSHMFIRQKQLKDSFWAATLYPFQLFTPTITPMTLILPQAMAFTIHHVLM